MFDLTAAWVLFFLPLPLVLFYTFPKAKPVLPQALKIPFFETIKPLVLEEKSSISRARSDLLLPALIWCILLFALSGPRWVGPPQQLSREGYQILLALDLSESMEIPDMLQNGRRLSRLTVVKAAAKQFVADRVGDKIGLILFGTRAYLQTPLTYDKQNVLTRIEDASAGLAGPNTSIGDALGLAIKRLENLSSKKGRMIILLTDGANTSGVLSPLKAAELARDAKIKIYTIGLGSSTDPSDPTNDLDEDSLKKIAQMTDARFFRATDPATLQAIYQTINQLERIEDKNTPKIRPQKAYYQWFVGLALLLSFYWISQSMHLNLGRFKS